MRFLNRVVLGAMALGVSAPSVAQSPPPPCESAAYRAFDFWIGEWNVRGANGKLAGTNSIKREINGCVLHERYQTDRGYSGESFNIYDAPRNVWHQTWVDSDGLLLLLEGGLRDRSVRQLWESTGPDGKWTVAFDGKYTRSSP